MANPTNKGSFAQRMALMSNSVENWDDDADFQGDLFTNSVSTVQTSQSSRVSVRSESNIGDDDWQVLITPNDELSTLHAISSAKQAGIPIPLGVPSSALLGGSIKKLGKKKSQRKIIADDDWGDDLELPTAGFETLKLKAPQLPRTPAEDQDEFDDWGEGSLGIRFGGTKRDGRNRGSSVSAMSPSMNSCMTLESEEDDITGLVLPEQLDFNARLKKLQEAEQNTPDVSPEPAHPHRRDQAPTSVPDFSPHDAPSSSPSPAEPIQPAPKPKPVEEDDFFADLDIGAGDIIDTKKATVNRHVVVQKPTPKAAAPPASRPATTLTFTDKPSISRIPRPLQASASRSKLTPIHEQGAQSKSTARPMPTTTHAQLLRAKRSAPVLRNSFNNAPKPPVPFLPAGGSSSQSHHVKSKSSQTHLRRDSDPNNSNRPLSPAMRSYSNNRPQSPAMRSFSRMSATNPPETPSRAGMRRDLAPAALQREAAAKRALALPKRRRAFGDGSELEVFDDLPTSAAKEKKFEKVPIARGPVKSLRHQQSNTRLPLPDRMQTPAPPATPRSPTKPDSTPRFARDTAASRIAREQRLAGTRSRQDGPVAPVQTNWKAKVAASSPHTSPSAQRTKRGTGQKPFLINPMSAPRAENMKGMRYNPILHRWEGNEAILDSFSHPNTSSTTLGNLTIASTPTFAPPHQPSPYSHDRSQSIPHIFQSQPQGRHTSSRPANINPPSPPRAPALISHITATRGVQVERGMVFDPRQMKWLKLGPSSRAGAMSPSGDDDDDPFAGLDDLKDEENKVTVGAGGAPSVTSGFGDSSKMDDPSFVGEEFDLGPGFIRRQREEEAVWRRRVEGWFEGGRDSGEGWRWAVRDLAELAAAENLRR
ncbi:hypothetical protein BU16DRAFT_468720 [Lophium mytilinum]|uniref:Cytokinesis regulator n=1 Tax=Lophium mytilinum TaxID=390894 RepID=A0A6A6QHQ8_9PEZI|nr:hypothetical protein BU16DRAFT_468720 [Lophium mytilinum]